MTRTTLHRAASAGAALGLLTFGLTACSGDSGDSTSTTSSASQSAGSTSSAAPGSVSPSSTGQASSSQDSTPDDIQALPKTPADFLGIVKDVKLTKCDTKSGNAVAEGTTKNTQKTDRDLLIAVSWLKQAGGGDSYALKVFTKSKVPAGDTVKFSLKAKLNGDAARCVIQAKSFKAGSLKK